MLKVLARSKAGSKSFNVFPHAGLLQLMTETKHVRDPVMLFCDFGKKLGISKFGT